MTQSVGTVAGFFSGGGKAAKFPTKGTTVAGTITAVHPPEPQRDFETGKDIPGKEQVRIELATDLRDPDVEFDDGARTLYVRGTMKFEIGKALNKAGVNEPKIGGTLSITYTGDGVPSRPGFNGPKQYSATYTPPAASTGSFFNNGSGDAPAPGAGETANAPIPDAPPPGIDPKAWAAMPADAKQAIANTMSDKPPY